MKSRKILLFALIAGLSFLFFSIGDAENAGRSFYNLKSSYAQNDTTDVAQIVQNKINRDMFYTVFDWVTVKDSSNIIVLHGWVHVPWDKEIFEKTALKNSGSMIVKNEIRTVLGDDDLRWQAARSIYTDAEFENNVFLQNPPIHIIVIGENVYLYGNTLSNSQKQWACDLIRFGTNSVEIFNHLKVRGNEVS